MGTHAAGIAGVVAGIASAQAQWTAIPLHPEGHWRSQVNAVSAGHQYGTSQSYTTPVAPTIWQGSATNWTALNEGGTILGVGGDELVGVVAGHASRWTGSPLGRVDLHTPWWWSSFATATSGAEQVGYYIPGQGQPTYAVLWRGSAESVEELHPGGAADSRATAAVPGLQGGYARFASPTTPSRAVVWAGTAASFQVLHPPTMVASQILGMSPGQQVGWVQRMPGQGDHAALWTGTAASILDLHPVSAGVSQLMATCGSAQAGYANLFASGISAGIWFGTAESFIPLAPYLPSGYYDSVATSIATDGSRFYVGGYARRLTDGEREAFLWVGIPAPGTLPLLAAACLWAARRRR